MAAYSASSGVLAPKPSSVSTGNEQAVHQIGFSGHGVLGARVRAAHRRKHRGGATIVDAALGRVTCPRLYGTREYRSRALVFRERPASETLLKFPKRGVGIFNVPAIAGIKNSQSVSMKDGHSLTDTPFQC